MNTSSTTHNALALIIDGQTIATTDKMETRFCEAPIDYALIKEDGSIAWLSTDEALRMIGRVERNNLTLKSVTRVTL